VFWALSQALRAALRGIIAAPTLELGDAGTSSLPPSDAGGAASASASGTAPAFVFAPPSGTPEAPDTPVPSESPDSAAASSDSPEARPAAHGDTVALFPGASSSASHASHSSSASSRIPFAAPSPEFTGAPCLQIHGSFILVAVRGGFLLVNQRAAHERILYEKALDDLRKPGRFSAQQLLFPEVVEFGAAEARLVEKHAAELRGLGFDLEPFGSTAFQLRGSPADAPSDQAQAILQDLVGRLMDDTPRGKDAPDEIHKRVARAYARAAAVPLDTPLDAPRMAALVDGLFATQN